jgi:rubredoxin
MPTEITHICIVCNHLHNNKEEGEWEQLPKDFKCPTCGCNKDEYRDELRHSI